MLSEFFVNFTLQGTQQWPEPQVLNRMLKQKMKKRLKATPRNSKCRYGERGAAAAKPKTQIILDAAKVSAASGGNSEPKQGQRSQSARGFCPRSTMRVPQPDIIEHFGNADAVPQLPERCLSRKAGIVRYCPTLSWRAHNVRPYGFYRANIRFGGQLSPISRCNALPCSQRGFYFARS